MNDNERLRGLTGEARRQEQLKIIEEYKVRNPSIIYRMTGTLEELFDAIEYAKNPVEIPVFINEEKMSRMEEEFEANLSPESKIRLEELTKQCEEEDMKTSKRLGWEGSLRKNS